MDENIFAYGPILRTLSNDEFDLTEPFQKMQEVWKDLTKVYEYAHKTKVVKREEIPNANDFPPISVPKSHLINMYPHPY